MPLDALIAVTAIESHRHQCLVVGEDLGTVPEGLRERLSAAHILSYRVLWFEREGPGFKPADAYPAQALACLASHDLPTFMGWRATMAALALAPAQVAAAMNVKATTCNCGRQTSLLSGKGIAVILGSCARTKNVNIHGEVSVVRV